jgi:hypothetical protein
MQEKHKCKIFHKKTCKKNSSGKFLIEKTCKKGIFDTETGLKSGYGTSTANKRTTKETDKH